MTEVVVLFIFIVYTILPFSNKDNINKITAVNQSKIIRSELTVFPFYFLLRFSTKLVKNKNVLSKKYLKSEYIVIPTNRELIPNQLFIQ